MQTLVVAYTVVSQWTDCVLTTLDFRRIQSTERPSFGLPVKPDDRHRGTALRLIQCALSLRTTAQCQYNITASAQVSRSMIAKSDSRPRSSGTKGPFCPLPLCGGLLCQVAGEFLERDLLVFVGVGLLHR